MCVLCVCVRVRACVYVCVYVHVVCVAHTFKFNTIVLMKCVGLYACTAFSEPLLLIGVLELPAASSRQGAAHVSRRRVARRLHVVFLLQRLADDFHFFTQLFSRYFDIAHLGVLISC